MLPSRRLPKAFQRPASPLSRRIARKLTEGRTRRKIHDRLTTWGRRFRRTERLWRGGLFHLKLWVVAAGILVPLALILFVLLSSTFTISSIRVSRQDRRVDVEEIQKLLAPVFGRHIVLVSPALLAGEIESAYPEVSSVTVKRVFPNELHVTLSMDRIIAEVRIGQPDDTETTFTPIAAVGAGTGSTALHRYITQKGVYLEYPFALDAKDNESRLALDCVDWAVKPEHRQHLMRPETLETIAQAKNILEQSFGASVPVVTVYLRAKEFHVRTVSAAGRSSGKEAVVLWLDFATPLMQQINRYREFLQALSTNAAEEYVDLRLHNRVVYR